MSAFSRSQELAFGTSVLQVHHHHQFIIIIIITCKPG